MNTLIVESKNDKAFVEALIRAMNTPPNAAGVQANVDPPICNIESFECLDGLDKQKLRVKIQDVLADVGVSGRDVGKLGILIDLDQQTEEDRIVWLNRIVEAAFLNAKGLNVPALFPRTNTLNSVQIDSDINLQLACHFTNYEGRGELETVLKAIKTQAAPHADCLEAWRTCIQNAGQRISDKDFDKFWLNNYIRYDTCSREDQQQAGRKCSITNIEYVFKKKPQIFNFQADELENLREFLRLFAV